MDKETVITHLQIIKIWAEFARERDLQFFTAKHLEDIAKWSDDALAMLKEQPEIVRCKDCGNRECDGRAGRVVCGITGESHSRLWFCADGKREEGR